MSRVVDVHLLLLWCLSFVLFFIGVWHIDLWVSSEQWRFVSGFGGETFFFNGFWSVSPAKLYHVYLAFEYVGFMLMCFVAIYCFVRYRE